MFTTGLILLGSGLILLSLLSIFFIYTLFAKKKQRDSIKDRYSEEGPILIKQIISIQKLSAEERTQIIFDYIIERKKFENLKKVHQEIFINESPKSLAEIIRKVDAALKINIEEIDLSIILKTGDAVLEHGVSDKWMGNRPVKIEELINELKINTNTASEEIANIKIALSQLREEQHELSNAIRLYNERNHTYSMYNQDDHLSGNRRSEFQLKKGK